jgi:hypothetical protein
MEEQIKTLTDTSGKNCRKIEDFTTSFQNFKDNDFRHLNLDVERMKMSMRLNNKLTWAILISVLGLAFFVIRSVVIGE